MPIGLKTGPLAFTPPTHSQQLVRHDLLLWAACRVVSHSIGLSQDGHLQTRRLKGTPNSHAHSSTRPLVSTHIGNVHPNVPELPSPAASPDGPAVPAIHHTDDIGHVGHRGADAGPAHSPVEEVVCYEVQTAALPISHARWQLAEGPWEGQWGRGKVGGALCHTPTHCVHYDPPLLQSA